MTNPQDDAVTLASVYAAHEDEVYEREYENRRYAAIQHLALISIHHPNPGRLLDVGCATGIFACAAHERGWDATGVDASDWMIARARSRCPTVSFLAADLGDVNLPAEGFDVVTLWDVLEHVPSPRQTLQGLRRWLSPGGALFLSVPNVASMTARLLGRRWVLLLREHLWYFSPESIALLLSGTGFDVVQIRPKVVRFSFANVLARLAQYPGILGAFSRGLSRLPGGRSVSLRFAIGEMDVVARVK